jgi:peptide-methionine (S)-S-oxide reductase
MTVTFKSFAKFFTGLAAALVCAAAFAQASTPTVGRDQTPRVAAVKTIQVPQGMAVATFAGGCFWCVEADFDKVPGVLSTISGYIGGKTKDPDYKAVSAGGTGHTEAVQIVYDPSKVMYRQLVDYFWKTIDPTVRDRQFCDAGSMYRTGVFTHNDDQHKDAQASRDAVSLAKPFKDPIVTEITRASDFYVAEDYHQDYYKKNPVRYSYYRNGCGRDERLKQLWGGLPKF